MYVYYFNGKDNKLHVTKGTIGREFIFRKRVHYQVNLEAWDVDKKWLKVLKDEGEVYQRSFWLEEYDLEKATKIRDDYERSMKEYYAKKASKYVEP